MTLGIILLIICIILFVLLNFAVWVYCEMEKFKKSWQDKKYIEAILNVIGISMLILGGVFPKYYLFFIGFCLIGVANIIYVIGVIRHKKDVKGQSDEK